MEVYAKGKNIPTYAFGNLFIQGEKLADEIVFIVDRYYCGKDLSLCTFAIRGVTETNYEANQVLPMTVDIRTLRLVWRVDENFTVNSGKLLLELRASEMIGDEPSVIIKYNMPPVEVAPTVSGINGPLPETSEQAVSEINDAVGEGLVTIQQMINSFNITRYENMIANETQLALAIIQEKIDSFDLSSFERRLSALEASVAALLARPKIIPLTRAQYDALAVKEDALYVITGEV